MLKNVQKSSVSRDTTAKALSGKFSVVKKVTHHQRFVTHNVRKAVAGLVPSKALAPHLSFFQLYKIFQLYAWDASHEGKSM